MSPTSITQVPVDRIDPHPFNPRRTVGDLTELVASIEVHGVRQNLLVVPQATCSCNPRSTAGWVSALDGGSHLDDVCGACSKPRRFTVVIGHRRHAAAAEANLDHVPAVVDDQLDAAGQIELMLLENLQRVDLTPIEEAKGYQDLLDLGHTTAQIVAKTGRSQTTVTGRLKLLKMAPAAQDAIHAGQATLEDAADLQWVTEHAEKRHAKLIEKATAAIGTNNYAWELKNARQAVERAQTKTLRENLVEASGMKTIKTTDGYAYVRQIWARTEPEIAAELKAYKRKKDHVVKVDAHGIYVYRERTKDEVIKKAGTTRAQEIRDEIRAREEADWETASELRAEFVRGILGRKQLLKAWQTAIVETVAPLILVGNLSVRAGQAHKWLNPTSTDHWPKQSEVRAALDKQLEEADAHAFLLLALTLYVDDYRTWQGHAARALYDLLELMGYETSDTESHYLDEAARKAAGEDERED